jgi:hypothetical protein
MASAKHPSLLAPTPVPIPFDQVDMTLKYLSPLPKMARNEGLRSKVVLKLAIAVVLDPCVALCPHQPLRHGW